MSQTNVTSQSTMSKIKAMGPGILMASSGRRGGSHIVSSTKLVVLMDGPC